MLCLQLEGTCSPLLPTAVPYAAEDMHTHCTAIHDRSLLLSPWEVGGSVDTQALCHQPHGSVTSSPSHASFSFFTPFSLEPLQGRVETASAPGGPWHGWLVLSMCPVSLRAGVC